MKKLVVTLIAAIGMGGVALAADIPDEAPAPPPPAPERFDWTGFYLGAQGGYEWRKDDFEDPIVPFSGDLKFDGAVLGGHVGYDHQFNGFVLGIVGDIEWADGSGTGTVSGTSVMGRAEANWQGSIRARLGYAFERAMVYVTGGASFGNFDFDYTCCGLGFGIGDQFDETVWGWNIGGGLAYKINNNWEIWGDYRYTDYKEASSGIINCCAGPPNTQDHNVDTHAARIGVSYRFNPGGP